MTALATQALAEGALGQALLHIERADLAAARPLLQEAVSGGVSTGSNASLYHGAPALEFVLGRAGRVDRDVQAGVDRVVAARLAAARQRQQEGLLPSLAEFDLISGLTGLGALLLARPGAPAVEHRLQNSILGVQQRDTVDQLKTSRSRKQLFTFTHERLPPSDA